MVALVPKGANRLVQDCVIFEFDPKHPGRAKSSLRNWIDQIVDKEIAGMRNESEEGKRAETQ